MHRTCTQRHGLNYILSVSRNHIWYVTKNNNNTSPQIKLVWTFWVRMVYNVFPMFSNVLSVCGWFIIIIQVAIITLAFWVNVTGKASVQWKKWYFYLQDWKYPTRPWTNRATEGHYWKTTGKDKEIFNSRMVVGIWVPSSIHKI